MYSSLLQLYFPSWNLALEIPVRHVHTVHNKILTPNKRILTRSQTCHFLTCHINCRFLLEASFGLRVFSMPAPLCVCANHLLVCAITRNPFKLGSQNLDRRCKTPWLRFLFFRGKWSCQRLKSAIYAIMSLKFVSAITHHPFKLRSPNLYRESHIGFSKLHHYRFRWWFIAWSVSCDYLNFGGL